MRLKPYRAIVGALASAVVVGLAPISAASAAAEPTYRHTFTVIDRLGNADVSATSGMFMSNLATGKYYEPTTVDGKWQVEAPAGEYGLLARVFTPASGGAGPSYTMEARSRLQLDHDTTDTLDARQAGKLTFDVGRADAAQVSTTVDIVLTAPAEWGNPSYTMQSGDASDAKVTDLYVGAQTGDNLRANIRTTLARPDGHGGFVDSPYAYHLLYSAPGGLPEPVQHVDVSQLASVKQAYLARRDDESAYTYTTGRMPSPTYYGEWHSVRLDVALPTRRTEYFSPAPALWQQNVDLYKAGNRGTGWSISRALTFQPGEVVKENRWNGAVVGPALRGAQPSLSGNPMTEFRSDDNTIYINPELFSDGNPQHTGYDFDTTETRRLYFGDELVPWNSFSTSSAPVGDRSGTFRLEAEGTRETAPGAKVSAVWTFKSKPTGAYQVLPLRVIRFSPKVDDHNRAKAGATVTVPITVQKQLAGPAVAVATLTVDVSYDDGLTWTAVPLTGKGDNWKATLTYPAAGAFVSLRGTAVDKQGNSVTETMLHAYQLA